MSEIADILRAVIPFFAILLVLMVAHEFGHFITAKMAGVKILEAGVGLPPRAWGKQIGETMYSINWLPLGAFVLPLGEKDDDNNPQSINAQKAWKRLIFFSAGSAMNFLMAVLLFAIALMIPREVPVGRALIANVMPESPAQQAGLESGDVILKINSRDVKNVAEASYYIRLNQGEDITFTVRRGEETLQFSAYSRWAPPDFVHTVEPGEDVRSVAQRYGFDADTVRQAAGIEFELEEGRTLSIQDGDQTISYAVEKGDTVSSVATALLVREEQVRAAAGLPDQDTLEPGQSLRFQQGPTGISIASQYPFTETQYLKPWEAFPRALTTTYESLILARNQIIGWVKGAAAPAVAGPVGIAQTTGEVFKEAGWKSLIDFAALLSVNLAILNILPLPMLDGGRIAFVLVEIARRGKRVAPQKEAIVHLAGLVALLLFAAVMTYFDILRIFEGGSLLK